MRARLACNRWASWVQLGIVFAPVTVKIGTIERYRAGMGSYDTCPGLVRIFCGQCPQTTIYLINELENQA